MKWIPVVYVYVAILQIIRSYLYLYGLLPSCSAL